MDSKLVSVAFEVFVDEKSISGNFIKRSYLSFEKMLFPLVKGLPFELHFILVHQIVFLLKTAVYRCRTCILNKEIHPTLEQEMLLFSITRMSFLLVGLKNSIE